VAVALLCLNELCARSHSDATERQLGIQESTSVLRSRRNVQLLKIQDVRVDQSIRQRIFGAGNISIETSGESSRLEMDNLDRPQTIADEIIAALQEHGNAQTPVKPYLLIATPIESRREARDAGVRGEGIEAVEASASAARRKQ